MEGKLHIQDNFNSLALPVELDVPKLEIKSSRYGIIFNYRWKIGIEVRDGTTTISTVHGSGRGQAARFDELAGPEIASMRLSLTRQLRRIAAPEKMFDGEQDVSVYVSDDDIERIQQTISDFVASPDGGTFWLGGSGPYSKETIVQMIEESAEQARVAALTPEQRLLEAIFGKGYKRSSATD